jgi:hypothetical protein
MVTKYGKDTNLLLVYIDFILIIGLGADLRELSSSCGDYFFPRLCPLGGTLGCLLIFANSDPLFANRRCVILGLLISGILTPVAWLLTCILTPVSQTRNAYRLVSKPGGVFWLLFFNLFDQLWGSTVCTTSSSVMVGINCSCVIVNKAN